MFTKIDKKILITAIIILILFLVVGFVVYKYLINNGLKMDIPAEQEKELFSLPPENKEPSNLQPQKNNSEFQPQGVQIEGGGASGLTICLDKCGDGVCQKEDLNCEKGDFNCVCSENPQECLQDCK